MMSSSKKTSLLVVAAVMLIGAIFLQHVIDPWRHEFEPKNAAGAGTAEANLPIEFALGAAVGFREAIAGLLWVRTDEFFHDGDYEAIVPMVRIITWLDPHNTDVYQTGAWHMDYNFTDASQRSDRRYIPLALALIEEGVKNNPNDTTMIADLAFTHEFRKILDYPAAVKWFEQGQALRTRPELRDTWDVTAIGHGLAHAYLATGQVDKAIAEWQLCVDEHKRRVAADHKDTIDIGGLNAAEKNLKETVLRKKWRAITTKPPISINLQTDLTRVAPMVFELTGTANFIGSKNFILETGAHTWAPADGCRVQIRLQDANYKFPKDEPFTLNSAAPKDITIMQDSAPFLKGAMKKKLDMSTDHAGADPMYSFAAPKYTLTIWFNPGAESDDPPFVADRIGSMGEGMTDPNYLDTSGVLPGTPDSVVPGLRMLKRTYTLTRDDIMGSGLKDFH